MQNKLGVMQGRLLPKYQGRYQAFPISSWQNEFKIAKYCDLDLIEFILDFNDVEKSLILLNGNIQKSENDKSLSVITFEKTSISLTGLSTKTISEPKIQETPTLQIIYCMQNL